MRSGGSPTPLTPEQEAAWRTYLRAHALLVRQLDQDLRVAHRMTMVTYNAPCSAGWPEETGGTLRADVHGSARQ
jgi:hypothetical protein